MKKLLILALLSFLSSSLLAQTIVPKVISSDQTWTIAGSPYILDQVSHIDTGVSVIVMPGVEILAQNKSILTVGGEFQILGTEDSMVFVDKLKLQYQEGSLSYDSSTQEGAYINYAIFTGAGVATTTIQIQNVNVRIENSKFLDFYFAIYAITPNQTRKLEVHNCQFIDSTNNGYPLYVSASDWEADITNNEFFGGNYFYLNGKIRFENNLVNNLNSVSFVSSNGCEVLCNTFKNIKNNIDYRLSNSDSNQLNHFMYNTLDSIGDGNPSATMLNVYRSVQNNAYLGDFKITNNNFLTNLGSNKKLAFYGMNSNTSTFYLTDTRDNYWATMDSALIQSYISDYNDDINIFCMADVSSIAGSQITGCGGASFECEASYYVAVDKLNKYNIFIINNSKGTTANTTYNWTFGDGQYSANQTPTHSYNDFGKYEVCLNINDPSNTCQDQFCDSIGMDENGTLFKVTSFTISVLNEADVLDIEDLPFASTSIYPNPVDDILYIVYETGILEDAEMELVNAHGAVVAKESWSAEFGIPYHQIDLSDFAEGVYYLTLRSGNQYRMIKIVKQ